ncbi:MAG: hypothetical protein KIS94_00180 [Chitinophagales bacterium]|nr:hypothetical protein [Chitinophagales bacterium]
MVNDIRKFENFHIVLWLIKDVCWVMHMRPAGMFMIVPTISMAFFIAWRSRKDISEFLHNIAVCMWICANATWMTGEFFFDDDQLFRDIASGFFIAGLLVIGVYYAFFLPRSKQSSSKRLEIL